MTVLYLLLRGYYCRFVIPNICLFCCFSVTNSGKSVESYVRGWIPKPSNVSYIVEYAGEFSVPSDFGCPGAVLITNLHGKEFYLVEIIVHGFSGGPVFFPANTWIHSRNDNPESRIIFNNQVSHC